MRRVRSYHLNFIYCTLNFFLILSILILSSCERENKEILNNDINITPGLLYPDPDFSLSTDPAHLLKAGKISELISSKKNKFNGCVLVASKGKIIYKSCEGYADFNTKEKLTDSSSFHLASVSKQFTAMAIMMLKEEGKLEYDDDVKKFLPGLPYEGITIRHLLNHTSGIRNVLNYIPHFLTYWDSCDVARTCDMEYIYQRHQPPLQFKPGTRFSYNNSGYVLLALIVERVSGKTYEQYVQEKIFRPLNMHNSFVYNIADESALKNRVYGYKAHKRSYAPDDEDVRNGMVGEKGIYASVDDLFKWDQALYTDRLVRKATLEEAFDNGVLKNNKKILYGFGWRKSKKDDCLVYHFGHWRGFKTCIIRMMDEENVIIVLNNTGSSLVKSLAGSIMKVLEARETEME